MGGNYRPRPPPLLHCHRSQHRRGMCAWARMFSFHSSPLPQHAVHHSISASTNTFFFPSTSLLVGSFIPPLPRARPTRFLDFLAHPISCSCPSSTDLSLAQLHDQPCHDDCCSYRAVLHRRLCNPWRIFKSVGATHFVFGWPSHSQQGACHPLLPSLLGPWLLFLSCLDSIPLWL